MIVTFDSRGKYLQIDFDSNCYIVRKKVKKVDALNSIKIKYRDFNHIEAALRAAKYRKKTEDYPYQEKE